MASFNQIRNLLVEQQYSPQKINQFEDLFTLYKAKEKGPDWDQISSPQKGSIIPYESLETAKKEAKKRNIPYTFKQL